MLKACPKVHGYCSELYLNLHVLFFLGQIDGNLNDKMKASVSGVLGSFNIILALNDPDIVLSLKTIGKHINIINKGTDNPYTGYIRQILINVGRF